MANVNLFNHSFSSFILASFSFFLSFTLFLLDFSSLQFPPPTLSSILQFIRSKPNLEKSTPACLLKTSRFYLLQKRCRRNMEPLGAKYTWWIFRRAPMGWEFRWRVTRTEPRCPFMFAV